MNILYPAVHATCHGPSWAIMGYFWLLTIIFGFLKVDGLASPFQIRCTARSSWTGRRPRDLSRSKLSDNIANRHTWTFNEMLMNAQSEFNQCSECLVNVQSLISLFNEHSMKLEWNIQWTFNETAEWVPRAVPGKEDPPGAPAFHRARYPTRHLPHAAKYHNLKPTT